LSTENIKYSKYLKKSIALLELNQYNNHIIK
jgi:hypothetical protein